MLPEPHALRDRTGEVLADRYELLSLLGRGGQSAVYRARDRRDLDEVAVKVLLPNRDPDSVERMYREAFAMSTLQDTAAVRVLHQIRAEDGTLALVMEKLSGCDLDVYLTTREARGERPSLLTIRAIMEPIVNTLEAAHARGIIHRDLKPANVWICDPDHGGGVRLLDFGFAKLTGSMPITGADEVAGTPTYIAPEVFAGGASRADARADVYSLAALVFRMLTGRVPFQGTLVEILRDVTTGPRPSLHRERPDLPRAVDEWSAQALAIRPDERFSRVSAMWRALLSCLEA